MSFDGWDTYIPCQHPVFSCQWWELEDGVIIPCPLSEHSNGVREKGTLHFIYPIGHGVLLECNETNCTNRIIWMNKSFMDRHRLER